MKRSTWIVVGLVIAETALGHASIRQAHAQSPLVVDVETSVSGGARPIVIGTTNLPDGTHLNVLMRKPWLPNAQERLSKGLAACGGDCFPMTATPTGAGRFADDVVVNRGHFSDGPFTDKGAALSPGAYILEITIDFAAMMEPPSVLAKIGQHRENMTGPLVGQCCFASHQSPHEIQKVLDDRRKNTPVLGASIYYARYVQIADQGAAAPSADQSGYATVVALPCIDLIRAYGSDRFEALIDPITEYISEKDTDGGMGSRINEEDYVLTACRLNEKSKVGDVVMKLFDEKARGQLPPIPIGGGTDDPQAQMDWDAFGKWIRHQGPQPQFSAGAQQAAPPSAAQSPPASQPQPGYDFTQASWANPRNWSTVEADNGANYKVYLKSVRHYTNGSVEVAVFVDESGATAAEGSLPGYNPRNLQGFMFDCHGHFAEYPYTMWAMAPPRSVAAQIGTIACGTPTGGQ